MFSVPCSDIIAAAFSDYATFSPTTSRAVHYITAAIYITMCYIDEMCILSMLPSSSYYKPLFYLSLDSSVVKKSVEGFMDICKRDCSQLSCQFPPLRIR